MAAGPIDSPIVTNEKLIKPSGKGFWPDPGTEAFRRPTRSPHKDHLNFKREKNPNSVNYFVQKGIPVYFVNTSDEEEVTSYTTVPECTNFVHKNQFECINFVNDDYTFIDEMWRNTVPECTDFIYNNYLHEVDYKNKNTYPGYQCSFIYPHNYDKHVDEPKNKIINQY